jgi:hypothetical protein
VVRSFETIPESRKIESEICVVETVGSNSRKGNKEEEEAISGIPEGYVRWVMDEDGHFW